MTIQCKRCGKDTDYDGSLSLCDYCSKRTEHNRERMLSAVHIRAVGPRDASGKSQFLNLMIDGGGIVAASDEGNNRPEGWPHQAFEFHVTLEDYREILPMALFGRADYIPVQETVKRPQT